MIGDVVNVAFRMEAANKDFGSRMIVSEQVRRAVEVVEARAGTSIHVRGRAEAVEIHSYA